MAYVIMITVSQTSWGLRHLRVPPGTPSPCRVPPSRVPSPMLMHPPSTMVPSGAPVCAQCPWSWCWAPPSMVGLCPFLTSLQVFMAMGESRLLQAEQPQFSQTLLVAETTQALFLVALPWALTGLLSSLSLLCWASRCSGDHGAGASTTGAASAALSSGEGAPRPASSFAWGSPG